MVGQAAGESVRVDALRGLGLLDTPAEDRFDRITRVAAAMFDVPIALVSLVDADRQWAKACIGLADRESPRSTSFCSVAVQADEPLIVPDAREHPRFAHYANVVGDPHLRFYAGIPVHTPEGFAVGTLCIADRRPREFASHELALLGDLATMVEGELARTDLHAALTAQRESEAHVRAVMDNVAEGIVTFGHDGIIRSANPAAERTFGVAPGALEGAHIEEIVAGAAWDDVHRRLPDVLGRRRLVSGRRADGGEFPLELVLSEADVGGGRVLIAIGQDVTERFRAEAALRESEQRFRAVFDDAAFGMVIVAPDGAIVDVNAALGELLGEPTDELRRRRISDLTGEEVDPRFRELFTGAREGYRREHRLTRRDGRVLWSDSTISVMRDADGRPRYAVGMIDDITERKEMQRLKDEFVSVVGHELRTPLTSIRGSLGLLAGGLAGDLAPEAREMVRMALDNTNRLVRLVNDTLDLERMQAGAGELEPRPVPARELVDAAVAVVGRLAAEAQLELRTEVGELDVHADPDRVVQALTNLLGNAVKFSPPGSDITVAVRRRGRDAEFSVRDRGRGIPADQLEAIFERFRQVDASDRREKGGTGLGLAIAREIVQRSRGRIWAESAPGAGATFVFTLPLAQQEVGIAVWDRRAQVRELLAGRLAELGLRAVPVGDGDELAAVAEGERIAAVVLAAGPAAAEIADHPALAALPKVLVQRPDEPGLLAALEEGVPALRPGRVLVIEDDPDLGRLLVEGLEHRRLTVELARTAREAREAIERTPPGLIVLDLILPGEDGFAVVDWLRRTGRLPDVPLLVYTARSLEPAERERLQLGRTEFLAKASVAPDELERRVAELLGCIAGERERAA